MRRTILTGIVCALVAALLGGCALTNREPEAVTEMRLPEPTDEPENMILGEKLSAASTEVTLYFAAQDGTGFSAVTRMISRNAGESLPQAAVTTLLDSGAERNMLSMADTRLLACEYACGTATVNLSIDARNVQSPQELLALQTSIGNTLLGIDGVRGVNVLIGGLSEGHCQLPLGIQTEPVTSVAAAYAQLQAERDRLSQAELTEPIARSALLYFPSATGDWLVPELRSISVGPEGFVSALFDALKSGPQEETCATAPIPEGVELLDGDPSIQTLSNGERVLDMNFASTLVPYMALSGLPAWKLAGSIAMTMCSFLPDLDAVRVMVDSEPITVCERGDTVMKFPEGRIHRRDFAGCVGSTVNLYLVNSEGMLQPTQRAVSMRSALSPRSLLAEMIRTAGGDNQPGFPVPEGIQPVDILGVQTSGGVARVNLSGTFYRCCQVLNAREERSLIYAMVNTLCQLDGIRGVRFYVEGCAAETMAGGIYLRSVLLPNPGIVVQRQ
ncbi:MAG: GerMN domain-containing protein [Clostridia bacterium]|nr:GerMN domain-containing protein [Clostridia bacterium]